MTVATWITMIGVMGLVWGGFALALRTALRNESLKRDGSAARSGESGGEGA